MAAPTAPRDIEWWVKESAVRLGKLWVPSRQAEQALSMYTKQLFCLTHHETYPYAFLGSCTTVRFRDKYFGVWCRHQTKNFAPDDVTIPIETGKNLISGSRFLYIAPDESNQSEEYIDLCAVEFVPSNYNSPNIEATFFDVRANECWQGNADGKFLVFGFPTERRIVDYETPHVHVSQVVTSARYSNASAAAAMHCLQMTRTTSFSSDGLSGGPVYHLARDRDGFFMGLAGIIVRGGDQSDYIHILDARFLVRLLDKHLADETKR